MKVVNLVCLIFILVIIYSCGPAIHRTGYRNIRNKDINECEKIQILYAPEHELRDLEIIGQIDIDDSGLSMKCSQEDIFNILHCEGSEINADIINIYEFQNPNIMSTCYRAKARFYKFSNNFFNIDSLIKKYSNAPMVKSYSDTTGSKQASRKLYAKTHIFYNELIKQVDSLNPDSCWSILINKIGNDIELSEDLFSVSSDGFYLCKGCIYDLELTGQLSGRYTCKLIDIKKDSLILTNYMNENVAKKASSPFDTITVSSYDLNKLYLIKDRILGIYTHISFNNYDINFIKDTIACGSYNYYSPVYFRDSTIYEVAPYLTGLGIIWLYEKDGNTFYYSGPSINSGEIEIDTVYRKRYPIWFTPCNVEEINGVAFGFWAENLKNSYIDDTLYVKGVNIEINPLALFIIFTGRFTLPQMDSLEFYETRLKNNWTTRIFGLNLSLIGSIGNFQTNGLTINGINHLVTNNNGLSITGLNTAVYEFNGVCISGIKNKSTKGKGLQIGLFNTCNSLKGFQIGLWNKNSKRSLPIINWSF